MGILPLLRSAHTDIHTHTHAKSIAHAQTAMLNEVSPAHDMTTFVIETILLMVNTNTEKSNDREKEKKSLKHHKQSIKRNSIS